jgi:uncharacterized membrane protein
MEHGIVDADKTTLRDLGNGLIILGFILSVIYIALLLLSFLVYAEGGWKVWTYPSMFGLAIGVILFLLLVGATLRYLPSSDAGAKYLDSKED